MLSNDASVHSWPVLEEVETVLVNRSGCSLLDSASREQ